jgi:hypothetical protein
LISLFFIYPENNSAGLLGFKLQADKPIDENKWKATKTDHIPWFAMVPQKTSSQVH